MGARLSDAKRAAILADIKDGTKSRNKIALEHDVSAGTVTNVAKEAGLTTAFDRSNVKKATAAAVADSKAVRAATSRRFLDKANELLDQMDQPHTAFAFGGRDNVYAEHEFAKPPVDALRTLMTTAAIAFDKHIAQDRHDTDDGSADLANVDAWLDSLTEGAGH
jgi:transposase-like protein